MSFTSGKGTKQQIGQYFDKISESIGDVASILVLGKWKSQIDEGVCTEKFDFNIEHIIFPLRRAKYMQPQRVQYFQDYKYLVKKNKKKKKKNSGIFENSSEHLRWYWSHYEGSHNTNAQFGIEPDFLIPFRRNAQCALQKAFIKNTDSVYRSIKQVSFYNIKDTNVNCSTLSFIVCA